MAETSMARG